MLPEVLIARKLRLAVIHQLWKDGTLGESDARELLAGPLVPGDVSTIYDDSPFLDDIEGLTRVAEQRDEAEMGAECPYCNDTHVLIDGDEERICWNCYDFEP